MMQKWLTVLVLLFPLICFSQAKDSTKFGTVTGVVKDSANDYALQSVTITVYKKGDSSLLNYQITDNDGGFNFNDVPLKIPIIVNLSSTGYKTFSKLITIDERIKKYDFKNILLARDFGTLEGVVVKAVAPITMNGDTLEINPDAFKLDSNAVVEDMLRRVPGITMWGDGTITVNGKLVNNVFVDGKPFFDTDPRIATQNLPKNAIEKIQVYQEEDYTKDNVDDNPADSLLTMNIKLKPEKKFGFFGKAGAGIGTDKRYEADASILGFNKKNRAGLAASSNNINKSANLQEMFQQGTYRNFNPNNRYVANFGGQGVNKVFFVGGNIQHNFSETTNSAFNDQLSGNFNFRANNNFINSQTNSANSASDEVFLTQTERNTISKSNAFNAATNYNKRDLDKNFSLSANVNTSTNNSNAITHTIKSVEDGAPLSESQDSSATTGNSNGFSISTNFRNKDDDDRNLKSFGINDNFSYTDNESLRKTFSNYISYQDSSQNRNLNRLYDNTSSNFSNNLSLNYNALKRLLFGNLSLWNINMVLNNNLEVSRVKSKSAVSDFDSITARYVNNDSLSNTNNITRLEDLPSLRLSKNFSKRLSDRFERYINISAAAQGQLISEKNESSFDYRNLNRSFGFFTPTAAIAYTYQKYNAFTINASLSGNTNASIPTIDQLRPILDTVNKYTINLGNTALKPSRNKIANFNFNFNQNNSAKKLDYNFNFNGSLGKVIDAIVDSSFYDKTNGKRKVYLINMDGRSSFTAGGKLGASLKMKKNSVLQFNYNVSFSNTTSPNYIDSIYTITKANNITHSFDFFYAYGDVGTFQLTQSINTGLSSQSAGSLKSLRTTNYITQGNINITPVKDLTFSSTVNYVKNNNANKNATLWNLFATYRFLKAKQAEIKLSAMDILGQNKNINTTADLNTVSTTITNGIQQFYMVTLSYYPRQFGKRAGGNSRRNTDGRFNRSNRPREGSQRSGEGGFRGGGRRGR